MIDNVVKEKMSIAMRTTVIALSNNSADSVDFEVSREISAPAHGAVGVVDNNVHGAVLDEIRQMK